MSRAPRTGRASFEAARRSASGADGKYGHTPRDAPTDARRPASSSSATRMIVGTRRLSVPAGVLDAEGRAVNARGADAAVHALAALPVPPPGSLGRSGFFMAAEGAVERLSPADDARVGRPVPCGPWFKPIRRTDRGSSRGLYLGRQRDGAIRRGAMACPSRLHRVASARRASARHRIGAIRLTTASSPTARGCVGFQMTTCAMRPSGRRAAWFATAAVWDTSTASMTLA